MSILKYIPSLYFSLLAINSFGQSAAHQKSSFAVIDPAYSTESAFPKSLRQANRTSWIYGPTELESYRLQVLQQRKDSAKLLVNYPGVYHTPYQSASFKLSLSAPANITRIHFRATGEGELLINDKPVEHFLASNSNQIIQIPSNTPIQSIQFNIAAESGIPALLVLSEDLSTSDSNWQWSIAKEQWTKAFHFPQNELNVPPHELENPSISLYPVNSTNGLYDFGRELYGYVKFKSKERPRMNVGESETEALDIENKVLEQSLELERTSDNSWVTKNPLAFRYVYVANNANVELSTEAIFYPTAYRGAFAASDEKLTQIWMNSAYTLRMNMHDFLLDGLKRDRLPWTGDLAMSLLVNAYTFNEPELVRRSMVALGRAGIEEAHINGIIDYSVWWVIAQDLYQLYYADMDHLNQEWARINAALNVLANQTDADGFLTTDKDTWLFIDWVEQEKWTALQIMWWWAQESAVNLAERMDDQAMIAKWTKRANLLKANINKATWNKREKAFSSSKEAKKDFTKHPNFLAVVSGLASESQYLGIKALLERDDIKNVGTPYMAGFQNIALARTGNTDDMLNNVRDYWGGMLEAGATTFWEAYDASQTGEEQYAFYGRPYAKSLNHAWSAGPAAFLPAETLGLRPIEDGWKRFTLNPNIGSLAWVSTTVPTKYGAIEVSVNQNTLEVTVPAGTTMEWNGRNIEGPKTIKESLK
ncbi:alpha-L-rhamnosidase C-terminal domain-containing protein [Roseivirga pacifica]|uniref:alpha-L-rhamnosidase-related protein n=1 Tax=Roseivirga pacifica TaxID=1267423 RepID=UPI00227D5796|nr:alpha-L-rhamnosidase C-terminal domain-containing protein [Roseivirga pacifica]